MPSQPHLAILHYAAPPTIGGVESTIAAHARLFADHGYAVKIIAGRGEPFDARVSLETIPHLDSRDASVEQVNRELARGAVTAAFDALVMTIRHALARAVADRDRPPLAPVGTPAQSREEVVLPSSHNSAVSTNAPEACHRPGSCRSVECGN